MTVTAVNNATNNATAQTGDASALLSQDYTTFLKLLTTQLQNQDPTQPMDSSQFTQQLVQFSNVEQQIAANKKLQNIIDLQNAGAAQQALNYLGKIGEVAGNGIPLVNGAGAFSYQLSTVATQNSVQILDANGNVVRTVEGSTNTAKHVVTWDGTNDAGTQLPDGLYTFKVVPTRTDGTAVTATTTTYGVINSVQTNSDGTTSLSMTYLKGTPADILSVNSSLSGVTNPIVTNNGSGDGSGGDETPPT
jgi:flagellar basal-body rod modification protein FlgD